MNKKDFIETVLGGKYNPALDEDVKNNPNPFPEKMAMAIATIEKYGLPEEFMRQQKRKKVKPKHEIPTLTPLQKELLDTYDFPISEEKLAQIKAFLQQILADEMAEKITKNENLVGLAA
jgi:hypothetical protein